MDFGAGACYVLVVLNSRRRLFKPKIKPIAEALRQPREHALRVELKNGLEAVGRAVAPTVLVVVEVSRR